MKDKYLLSGEQLEEFHENGFLVLSGLYDLKNEIEPIQYRIYQIIGLISKKYNLTLNRPEFSPDNFDAGYQEIIASHRKIGSEIYDAVKQIPEFIRLAASPAHSAIFSQIRGTDMPGLAARGSGIRIDNPFEEKYVAPWHQDYPAQFCSLDGIVFWSSLVPLTEAIGPAEFCIGSHKGGVRRVYTKDPKNPEKTGAYALILENEDELVSTYPHSAPLSKPGDTILIDFLTLHRSGYNKSNRSRWSMQMRYFNFKDPTGIKLSWCGSFAAGIKLKDVHPELVLD